ncbi:MAG: NAD(P)/FAD-dependent oxidoreductase [Planctomycetaceae bacterium]|nr:NAD(P)/FAD-dependent oxidoreductase [Planctomycetaceae bacterium]
MKYETLIIGAGLSGLAAGIRLAYYDQSVAILERHTTIGGLNSFYRLRGRNYDVGLHAVTNYAPRGSRKGPLSKLLRQLRLSWDDFGLCPQNESAVDFLSTRLTFTNELEVLDQQIQEAFPDQIEGFRRLAKHIDGHDSTQLNRQPLSGRKVVGDFLTDPMLIDMLFCPLLFYGSATPHDMDFHQFAILFKSIFCEGFARPEKGVRPILKALTRQFRENGGELKLRSGVKKILTHQGKAVGVELDSGEVLEANNVLSSAGLVETLRMTEGAETVAERERPGEISFVETIFTLDCLPSELGHDQTVVFYNESPDFHYVPSKVPVDTRSGIICSPNNFQYETQREAGTIRITALADPKPWMSWPEEEYVEQKTYWTEKIIESALRVMPDFREHIVETDAFTPRTIKKYTGHLNGAVYGAPDKRIDGRTEFENLYLCGTDQGFLGIIGAMLSGISIANAYLLQ